MDGTGIQNEWLSDEDEENEEIDEETEAYWRHALSLRPAWTSSALLSAHRGCRYEQANALAEEAHALHRLLSDVNARRNALRSPIHSLPPEILAMIFDYLADDAVNGYEEENDWYWPLFPEPPPNHEPPFERCYTERLGWILVTHVCRALRNAALNHASLWARVRVNGDFP
ncbi:hypothetical protein PENSPDRAFT_463691 [Peniophora sp. CONT]|nr:hypothetical protein PENSPDRAFT_463691 [Peniophora sp. CONT]